MTSLFNAACLIHLGLLTVLAAADPEPPFSWVVSLGSAAAAVLVTWLFLAFLREERKVRSTSESGFLTGLKEQRGEFTATLNEERNRVDGQRESFSDLLKHYREESTKTAQSGHEALEKQIETIKEIGDTVKAMKESHAELAAYINRAIKQLDKNQGQA